MQKCAAHATRTSLARMSGARLCLPGRWARVVTNASQSHPYQDVYLHCSPLHLKRTRFIHNEAADSRTACTRVSAIQDQVPGWPVKPDAPTSPFYDLGLEDLWDDMGHVRVRQHVNPLRIEFQTPHAPLPWHEVFSDPTKPLMVDVGCGSGRFLLKRQKTLGQDQNALGIEIRRALVKRANKWAELLHLNGSLHYVFANATVSLSSLLGSYPGPITLFAVQMPDPQFKKRHWKRRVVQPQLVRDMAALLAPNGRVFLQSDVEEVAVDMRNLFERCASDVFQPALLHLTTPVFFSNEIFVRPGPKQKQSKPATANIGIDANTHATTNPEETSQERPEASFQDVSQEGPEARPKAISEEISQVGSEARAEATCEEMSQEGPEARPEAISEEMSQDGPNASTSAGTSRHPEPHVSTSQESGFVAANAQAMLTSSPTFSSGQAAGPGQDVTSKWDEVPGQDTTCEPVTTSWQDMTSQQHATSGQDDVAKHDVISAQNDVSEPDVISEQHAISEQHVISEPDAISEPDVISEQDVISEPDVISEQDVISEPDVISEQDDVSGRSVVCEQDASGASSSDDAAMFESDWRKFGWLEVNPMGLPTEREHFALSEGGKVYRVLLVKGDNAASTG